MREYSSVHTQQPAGPVRDYQVVDPYLLLEDDLKDVYDDIRQVRNFFIIQFFISKI